MRSGTDAYHREIFSPGKDVFSAFNIVFIYDCYIVSKIDSNEVFFSLYLGINRRLLMVVDFNSSFSLVCQGT